MTPNLLATLIKANRNYILSVATRHAGASREDAEDALHDFVVKAIEEHGEELPDMNLSYIIQGVKRRAIDLTRRGRRLRDGSMIMVALQDDTPTVPAYVVPELTPRQLTILNETKSGRTQQQVAQIAGVSQSTVSRELQVIADKIRRVNGH